MFLKALSINIELVSPLSRARSQSMEASQVKTASISERTPPKPPPLTLPPVLCVCSSNNTSTTSALVRGTQLHYFVFAAPQILVRQCSGLHYFCFELHRPTISYLHYISLLSGCWNIMVNRKVCSQIPRPHYCCAICEAKRLIPRFGSKLKTTSISLVCSGRQ